MRLSPSPGVLLPSVPASAADMVGKNFQSDDEDTPAPPGELLTEFAPKFQAWMDDDDNESFTVQNTQSDCNALSNGNMNQEAHCELQSLGGKSEVLEWPIIPRWQLNRRASTSRIESSSEWNNVTKDLQIANDSNSLSSERVSSEDKHNMAEMPIPWWQLNRRASTRSIHDRSSEYSKSTTGPQNANDSDRLSDERVSRGNNNHESDLKPLGYNDMAQRPIPWWQFNRRASIIGSRNNGSDRNRSETRQNYTSCDDDGIEKEMVAGGEEIIEGSHHHLPDKESLYQQHGMIIDSSGKKLHPTSKEPIDTTCSNKTSPVTTEGDVERSWWSFSSAEASESNGDCQEEDCLPDEKLASLMTGTEEQQKPGGESSVGSIYDSRESLVGSIDDSREFATDVPINAESGIGDVVVHNMRINSDCEAENHSPHSENFDSLGKSHPSELYNITESDENVWSCSSAGTSLPVMNNVVDDPDDNLAHVWDSAKLCDIKEGVSLSRMSVVGHDDMSSIASSEHSGHVSMRKSFARTRRASVVSSSMFSSFRWASRSSIMKMDDVNTGFVKNMDDGLSTDAALSDILTKQATYAATRDEAKTNNGQPSRRKSFAQSSRRKSFVSSLSLNVLRRPDTSTQKKRFPVPVPSANFVLSDEYFAAEDAKCEAIVKEACELMSGVNKSTVAMGIEAPFRLVDEMFPPMKKLHQNLGYQMDSLKAAIGTPRSVSRRTRRLRKSIKQNKKNARRSLSYSFGSSDPPQLNDHTALSAYVMDQMTMLGIETPGVSSLSNLYTSFLPNFMWYQPIAADSSPSSMIRPTSLCSGTGITGDHQYLQPDMLKVFSHFGSYLVGSGHLFDDELGTANNKRRSAFWVETIDEEDSMSEASNSSYESIDSSSSDSDSDTCKMQKDLLEKVIEDLRCSQIKMGPRLMPNYKIRDGRSVTKTECSVMSDFSE